jgi:hypothetical protein
MSCGRTLQFLRFPYRRHLLAPKFCDAQEVSPELVEVGALVYHRASSEGTLPPTTRYVENTKARQAADAPSPELSELLV